MLGGGKGGWVGSGGGKGGWVGSGGGKAAWVGSGGGKAGWVGGGRVEEIKIMLPAPVMICFNH